MPTDDTLNAMIKVLGGRLNGRHMTSREYGWKRDLTLQQIGNVEYVVRTTVLDAHIQEFGLNHAYSCPKLCTVSNVFDAVYEAHECLGHPKVERTYKEVKSKYSNISRSMVEMFLDMCPICALDKIQPSRKIDQDPILSKTFNDRGQIDLIDMQSCPDGPYKWILHYQDNLTKFSYLRPLTKKSKYSVIITLIVNVSNYPKFYF